jgi:hypothetical protein
VALIRLNRFPFLYIVPTCSVSTRASSSALAATSACDAPSAASLIISSCQVLPPTGFQIQSNLGMTHLGKPFTF